MPLSTAICNTVTDRTVLPHFVLPDKNNTVKLNQLSQNKTVKLKLRQLSQNKTVKLKLPQLSQNKREKLKQNQLSPFPQSSFPSCFIEFWV